MNDAPRASPTPSGPDFTVRPGRVPDTSARALRLARQVIAGPGDFGADFVRQHPFESDPRTWAVLDGGCVWQREKLPKGVLASLSQHSVLPAKGAGKGPVRVMVVVSVHADADSADQEMATTLEEVVRCPEQRLNQDERIVSLLSSGAPWGRRGQETADDQIWEHGEYESDSAGGPYPYIWGSSRIGPVTVSVMVKGAKGYSEKETDDLLYTPLVKMAEAVKGELK